MSVSVPSRKARKRILIAEDDPAIGKLLQKALSLTYEVTLVEDGHGAIAQATKDPPPHLLLLDIMMPGLDGLQVAQQLKHFPNLAKAPIIFITAKDTPADVIRGIQMGARHYVRKPFAIVDLLKKIESVLRA